MAKYIYTDAWHTDEAGRPKEWKRLTVKDLAAFQASANNWNCFASIQLFANAEKERGEYHIAPLYFDLDFPENPEVAQADAIKLIDFFITELGLTESDIWVYFSGSKGFHILVSTGALKIDARPDLHKIYKHIASFLRHRLGETYFDQTEKKDKVIPLKSIDYQVYTCPRMLRLPNSVHSKTRLFKIELAVTELKTLSLADIKKLAEKPRNAVFASRPAEKREKAANFYANKVREYLEAAKTTEKKYAGEEYQFIKGEPPVCVQDILNGGWKKDGDRNMATVQLATYFKAAGHTYDETLAILEDWVQKFTTATADWEKKQKVANTRSVVTTVFEGDNNYRFGCAFIRSLHGPKPGDGSDEWDRVKCEGNFCKCIIQHKEDLEAVQVHLSKTGDAEYTGRLIRTRVLVAGKQRTPYIVPAKVEFFCWGREKCRKKYCPLYSTVNGVGYKEFTAKDRELIQFTASGDDNVTHVLKQISGVPSCTKYKTTVTEKINVTEIMAIPMAEKEDAVETNAKEYVMRKLYAVGVNLHENKYYELLGYVYNNPKDQSATIMVKDAVPLQDIVEKFRLTDQIKKDLREFRPAAWDMGAINEKLVDICDQITRNVTKVVERDDFLLGTLLSYHSVLQFFAPWDPELLRGWVELIVLGDTGTAKSKLVRTLMQFIGLGTSINAETSSRTGITYKLEQQGGKGSWFCVWGAYPLADGGFINVDEPQALSKENWGEMTIAREEGVLRVKRSVTAETNCRVRAVMTGNAPGGKRLADYAHGCEALKEIFNNEDVRRFDFGIFLRTTDVAPEVYNQPLAERKTAYVSGERLKNNILFAWSRKPEQVIITPEVADEILKVTTDISKVYGDATEVPLVSPSTQRNKVARLVVALAALTNSTDETGEKVVPQVGHVQYIFHYLKALYNSPGCSLNHYARLAVKEEELDPQKFAKLRDKLQELECLKDPYSFGSCMITFARQRYLRLGDVEAMLGIDKQEAKDLVTLLTRLKMTINTSGGYRKTARFNAFLSRCWEYGLLDNIEDDT